MADSKIEDFAEDLGKLLGTAQGKAEGWLNQRGQIAKTLEGIRDTATDLLQKLGHETKLVIGRRRGRPAGTKNAATIKLEAVPPKGARKRRKMSAAARARISAAQKARWAKQKAGERKK